MNVIKKITRLSWAWAKYLYSFTGIGGGVKDSKCWIFGEWVGHKCCDNGAFFANYVANRDKSINVYWSACKDTDTSMLDSRIKVLVYGSDEAESTLKKAGAIFVTHGFYDVSPCPYNFYGKAVSVNLHHGMPIKMGGYYFQGKFGFIYRTFIYKIYCKMVALVMNTRYLVTLSDEYTRIRAHDEFFNPNLIIKAGYPRNSIFYSSEKNKEAKEKLYTLIKNSHAELNTNGMKIIAYMPTWRASGAEIPDLQKVFSDDFAEWLEENNVIVIHKAHAVTDSTNKEQAIESSRNFKRVIAINDIIPSILLAGSDMLISDYSSCVFDYLILDRPVIHYAFDYEQFDLKSEKLRDLSEFNCGTVAYNADELQKAIIEGINFPDAQKELRRQRRERFMTYESPNSCEKIYNFVVQELARENEA